MRYKLPPDKAEVQIIQVKLWFLPITHFYENSSFSNPCRHARKAVKTWRFVIRASRNPQIGRSTEKTVDLTALVWTKRIVMYWILKMHCGFVQGKRQILNRLTVTVSILNRSNADFIWWKRKILTKNGKVKQPINKSDWIYFEMQFCIT